MTRKVLLITGESSVMSKETDIHYDKAQKFILMREELSD